MRRYIVSLLALLSVFGSKDFPYADYDGKCYKTWDSYRVNTYSDKQTQ